MRLTVFTYGYQPEHFLINEFCESLVQNKHQVQVFTGLPNYPKGEYFSGYSFFRGPYHENLNGVDVIRYPVFPRKKGFLFLLLNYLSHFIFGSLNVFRLQKSDAYFVFALSPITIAIPAIFLAKIRGVKVYVWLQDLWPESVAGVGALSEKSPLYKAVGWIVRWIYAHVDFIMIQSPGFHDNLKTFGYMGPVAEIPNWAPEIDDKLAASEPHWLSDFPSSFVVTFAGNIGKAQAIPTLLEAALLLKDEDIHFAFVGDGSELDMAQKFVAAHQLSRVKFYGRKASQDMPALFRKSSALLVSLNKNAVFEKTIPSKVQAYLAAGRPLLASLNGVGANMVETCRLGLASPSENAEKLAKNILRMKSLSPEELKEFGDRARSHFYHNFRKAPIIGQIETILKG